VFTTCPRVNTTRDAGLLWGSPSGPLRGQAPLSPRSNVTNYVVCTEFSRGDRWSPFVPRTRSGQNRATAGRSLLRRERSNYAIRILPRLGCSMLLEAKWALDSGLQRGQLLTSVREAAMKWGISKTQVSRFLPGCVIIKTFLTPNISSLERSLNHFFSGKQEIKCY
jgi:hypothetical protein